LNAYLSRSGRCSFEIITTKRTNENLILKIKVSAGKGRKGQRVREKNK